MKAPQQQMPVSASKAQAHSTTAQSKGDESASAFQDLRPEAAAQRRLKNEIAESNNSVAENHTGLPNQLKSGIENLSGHSMDDVKVHYNSSKPAQLNAHAYAQGSDIHVASGQEKHLPHEAWHVVQQKQGRVKPTMQLQGVGINDDVSLETEADVMGGKVAALQRKEQVVKPAQLPGTQSGKSGGVFQMKPSDFREHNVQGIAAKTGLFRTSYWKALQDSLAEYAEIKDTDFKKRRAKLREVGTLIERWLTARGMLEEGDETQLNRIEKEKYDAVVELRAEVKAEYSDIQDPNMLSGSGSLEVEAPDEEGVSADPQLTHTREEKDGRKRGFTNKEFKVLNAQGQEIGATIPVGTVCRVETRETGPEGKEAKKYSWLRQAPKADAEWGNRIEFTAGYALKEDVATASLEKKDKNLMYEGKKDAELFPLFQGPPSVEDVEQVSLGDCYLLAAVLSVVRNDPGFFPSIMKDHGNGVVSVKLFDVSEKPNKTFTPNIIHVNKSVVVKKDAKNSLQEGYNKGGLWVQMLEKAYAAGGNIGTTHEKLPSLQNSWSQISGGFSRVALETLTGRPVMEKTLNDESLGEMSAGRTWVSPGSSDAFTQILRDNKDKDDRTYFMLAIGGALTDFEKGLVKTSEDHDQVRLGDVFKLLPKIADAKLRKLVKDFIEDQKLYPDKRGTGIYSQFQLDTFMEIATAVDEGQNIMLSSNESVKKKGGLNSGSSAGEHVYRGLAGPHAYEVFDFSPSDYITNPREEILLWFKLRNPWGNTGRQYKDGLFGVDQPGGMNRAPLGGLKTSEKPTEEAEFWVPLADITKRFRRVTTQEKRAEPVLGGGLEEEAHVEEPKAKDPVILTSGETYSSTLYDLLSAVRQLAEDRGAEEDAAYLSDIVRDGIPFASAQEMTDALMETLLPKQQRVATAIVEYILDDCD